MLTSLAVLAFAAAQVDPAAFGPLLERLGFEPAFAAHAAFSCALFAAARKAARTLDFVPKRFEVLVPVALTAGVDATIAVSSGTAKLFPALSTAAAGAVVAWILHHAWTKRDGQGGEE